MTDALWPVVAIAVAGLAFVILAGYASIRVDEATLDAEPMPFPNHSLRSVKESHDD